MEFHVNAVKKPTDQEALEERARILHAISERWHGNLSAYLEAVARVRNETLCSSEQTSIIKFQSVRHLSKR
jgi:hypothetical protein